MLKKIFQIDETLAIPKYRQIINSINNAIESGILKQGDKVPSINSICKEFDLSRDTVLIAFNELKIKGIISSVPGKAYYIENENTIVQQRLFVLFDELNASKEILYTSLIKSLESNVIVDIYFHHFNYKTFKDLILQNAGKFTSYIIMPATFDNSYEVISVLPKNRVFILNRLKPDLLEYPAIYQDFELDIYENLLSCSKQLVKYKKLIMIATGYKYPNERNLGFSKFCTHFGIDHKTIMSSDLKKIEKGEAFIISSDRDLVHLIKMAHNSNFEIGRDIGIISLNDNILNEVLSKGITTISTDYAKMGKKIAQMVINNENLQLRNPSKVIKRESL